MKIFGKRKSKPANEGTDQASKAASAEQDVAAPEAAEADDNINIPSYFSNVDANSEPKKKKPKKNPSNEINGEEMETLLNMDYEKLNSKQRRLVRRYKERSGDDDHDDVVVDGKKSVDVDNSAVGGGDVVETEGEEVNIDGKVETIHKKAEPKTSMTDTTEPDKSTAMNDNEKELLTKLEGLNSKQRRQFLRQLRNDNPNNVDIDKLEEEAKRIAERNIQESKDTERQSQTPKKEEAKQIDTTKPPSSSSSSSKKKKKPKDLSHLTPEEIARREKQRQMQIEAAERRARGEDLNNGHRHPLNSERRRANRRKPARKAQSNARKEFNSVGFQMRKSG